MADGLLKKLMKSKTAKVLTILAAIKFGSLLYNKANADTFYISPDNPSINAIIGYECSVNPPTPENPHIFNLWDKDTGETGVYDDLTAQYDSGWLVIYNQPNCKVNGILNLTPDYKLDTTKPNTIVLQAFKCLGNNEITNLARKVTEDRAVGIWNSGDNITLENVHIFSQDGIIGPRGFYSRGTMSNNLIKGCSTYGLRYGVNTEEAANTVINTSVFQDGDYGFITDGYIFMGNTTGAPSRAEDPNNIGQNVFIGCKEWLGGIFGTPPVIPAEQNYWYDENRILLTSEVDIWARIRLMSSKPVSSLEGVEQYIDVIPFKTTPHPAFPGPTSVSDNVWNVYK